MPRPRTAAPKDHPAPQQDNIDILKWVLVTAVTLAILKQSVAVFNACIARSSVRPMKHEDVSSLDVVYGSDTEMDSLPVALRHSGHKNIIRKCREGEAKSKVSGSISSCMDHGWQLEEGVTFPFPIKFSGDCFYIEKQPLPMYMNGQFPDFCLWMPSEVENAKL